MADTPRRRGPKPRGPFENKRFALTLRITEETRRQIERAAQETGRSLSQEAELRLVQSFSTDLMERLAAAAAQAGAAAERAAEDAKRAADQAEQSVTETKMYIAGLPRTLS